MKVNMKNIDSLIICDGCGVVFYPDPDDDVLVECPNCNKVMEIMEKELKT